MANKPNIRFEGFTDDWEQRKFYETFTGLQNNTLSRAELNYENGTLMNVHYGDILVKFGEYIDVSEEKLPYITNETIIDKYNTSFLKDGDIIIADTAEDITAGKCSEIVGSDNFSIISGLHTIPCRPKFKFAPKYLGYYMNSSAYHNQLVPLMQGIKVTSISKSAIYNTELIYPKSADEQEKIGAYFSSLDHLITLHQRKCDETKKLKKFMLQKMFPKNGEKIPEIRFAGFTNDWEQRKVAEITKFHKQGFYTTEDYSEKKKYYLLRGTNLTENKLILKDTPKIDATEKDYQAFKTEVGDFLIVRSGTVGTYGIVYEDIPAIFGSYLIDFRFDMEQVTNEFFGYFYQSESFKSQLRQIVQQSANTNINAENIKSTSIMLPIIDEQKKIGDYLAQLDHLITLHQRKCDKLKQIKKYMLQNMFPQKG